MFLFKLAPYDKKTSSIPPPQKEEMDLGIQGWNSYTGWEWEMEKGSQDFFSGDIIWHLVL